MRLAVLVKSTEVRYNTGAFRATLGLKCPRLWPLIRIDYLKGGALLRRQL